MHQVFLVNMVKRDADHCQNSKDLLLWEKLLFEALDYISKTLVALFHNDAWKVIFIFDKINDAHNHRVIE
jgi:plasmid maintenance system killer protein